jgi:hypothetical protein
MISDSHKFTRLSSEKVDVFDDFFPPWVVNSCVCMSPSLFIGGLEEEGYTVSPLDSDFRVRYIVDVKGGNAKALTASQEVDSPPAGTYYHQQQDDDYHHQPDSSVLEDYYSSTGLDNAPNLVALSSPSGIHSFIHPA